MLSAEEIDLWSKLIEESKDLDLARKFYTKTGRPDKVKKESAAKTYPKCRNANFSDEKLSKFVNKRLREGSQGYYPGEKPREFARGLIEFPDMHEYPEEISYAYALFEDKKYQKFAEPRFAKNIVTLKVFHCLLLGLFEGASKIKDKYGQHYDRKLAHQFVNDFIGQTSFSEDEEERGWSLEYLVAAYRSEFGSLFMPKDNLTIEQRAEEFDDWIEKYKADIRRCDIGKAKEEYIGHYRRLNLANQIASYLDMSGQKGEVEATVETDKAVSAFENEYTKQQYAKKRGLSYKTTEELYADELNKAFDEAEDTFGILIGMKELEDLLSNDEYVKTVGKEKIKSILNERTERAIKNGKAHVVYALKFGTNLGDGDRLPSVSHFDEYVDVNKSSLLESMISAIEWNPEELLSDQYDFGCDNLTFEGTEEVDDTYDLYQKIQQEGGRLPSGKDIKKLIFLEIAMHVKETYKGKGMKIIKNVFENPANSDYIDPDQTKNLLIKVFADYFEKGRINGFREATSVPYFYTLASSRLGELIKDDKRIAHYFKLHQFLEAK